LVWRSTDETINIEQSLEGEMLPLELSEFDLCITGRALAVLQNTKLISEIISRVWVYARVSPSQKEFILASMKDMNYITLMCGDGTNDVGALKQAHIGTFKC
jgi:cation-transporting ATPase 13A1